MNEHATHDFPGSRYSMSERLFLLCWDADRGRVATPCSTSLAPALGGASVIDAIEAGVVSTEGGTVTLHRQAEDQLLQSLVEQVERSRRPMTVEKLVPRVGTGKLQQQVRDRLVARGALRAEERRVLGIFPSTSHPVVDVASQEAIRASVHDLVTGHRDPASAHPDEVMLAAMAGPSEALTLLIADRRVRRDAKKRAEDLANGEGIPPAVGKAIAEAQAAMIAAFAAVSAATAATSSSSSNSG